MAVEIDSATTNSVENAVEASAATAGQHGATTEAAHGGGGLPQFQFEHWGGQIAYLLVLFAILFFLISKVFAPRIRRVFDEREATIRDALDSARSVQAQADAQAEAGKRALADARAAAQRTALEAKARASAETEARKTALEAELSAKQSEAEGRIRAARDAAMKQLAVVAADTAEAMVEKLTGAKPSRESIVAAVNSQG
jgi:F-type H+-transporting ATPase subunit b